MLYLVKITYPLTQISKVVEVLFETMEKQPDPDFVERVSWFSKWGGEGIEGNTLYEIDDSKAVEGIREITARLINFSSVDGVKIETSFVMSVEDALAVIGKELPSE